MNTHQLALARSLLADLGTEIRDIDLGQTLQPPTDLGELAGGGQMYLAVRLLDHDAAAVIEREGGYALVEYFLPGALSWSPNERGLRPPVVLEHDIQSVLGRVIAVSCGLHATRALLRCDLDDPRLPKIARAGLGVSVGCRVPISSFSGDARGGVDVHILGSEGVPVPLSEVTLTNRPAIPGAQVLRMWWGPHDNHAQQVWRDDAAMVADEEQLAVLQSEYDQWRGSQSVVFHPDQAWRRQVDLATSRHHRIW